MDLTESAPGVHTLLTHELWSPACTLSVYVCVSLPHPLAPWAPGPLGLSSTIRRTQPPGDCRCCLEGQQSSLPSQDHCPHTQYPNDRETRRGRLGEREAGRGISLPDPDFEQITCLSLCFLIRKLGKITAPTLHSCHRD